MEGEKTYPTYVTLRFFTADPKICPGVHTYTDPESQNDEEDEDRFDIIVIPATLKPDLFVSATFTCDRLQEDPTADGELQRTVWDKFLKREEQYLIRWGKAFLLSQHLMLETAEGQATAIDLVQNDVSMAIPLFPNGEVAERIATTIVYQAGNEEQAVCFQPWPVNDAEENIAHAMILPGLVRAAMVCMRGGARPSMQRQAIQALTTPGE